MADPLRRKILARLAWLGWTHAEFSLRIGVDKASFSRTLRAVHPQKKTLLKIAAGLGWTIEELLDDQFPDSVLTRPLAESGP